MQPTRNITEQTYLPYILEIDIQMLNFITMTFQKFSK